MKNQLKLFFLFVFLGFSVNGEIFKNTKIGEYFSHYGLKDQIHSKGSCMNRCHADFKEDYIIRPPFHDDYDIQVTPSCQCSPLCATDPSDPDCCYDFVEVCMSEPQLSYSDTITFDDNNFKVSKMKRMKIKKRCDNIMYKKYIII